MMVQGSTRLRNRLYGYVTGRVSSIRLRNRLALLLVGHPDARLRNRASRYVTGTRLRNGHG